MKFSQYYLVIVVTLGVVGFGFAAGPPVMNQFTGGDPASASQVNANFQELADRISDNPAALVYDYRDYQSSANSKTFATSGTLCGDVETRAFIRTANGNNTNIAMHRVRTNSGAICQEHGFEMVATPTEYQLLRKINYDGSGAKIEVSIDSLASAIIRRHSNMRTGITFGSGSSMVNTPVGMSGTATGGIIETSVILAVEDVTVSAGSYQNCLKIHITRTSNGIGAFHRLSWRCPNVGEVKRIQHELPSLAYREWELTAIN